MLPEVENNSFAYTQVEKTDENPRVKQKPETDENPRAKKRFKYDDVPSTENTWKKLYADVLFLVYQKFYNQEGLKKLLALRTINKESKGIVEVLVGELFKKISPTAKPSKEYLDKFLWALFSRNQTAENFKKGVVQFSKEGLDTYDKSDSRHFLNCLLYHYDSSDFFISDRSSYDSEDDYLKSTLQELISKHIFCVKFQLDSLMPLVDYDKHLRSQGMALEPVVIRCDLTDDFVDKKNIKEHYQNLKPFLTCHLTELDLAIDFTEFRGITEPENESESSGRIGKLLFGKKLPNLTKLRLSHYTGADIEPTEATLTEKDVRDLERLVPNLRDLELNESTLTKDFIVGLLNSPLISRLKSLNLYNSIIENYSCFGSLLEASMPNLKKLGLPLFIEFVDADAADVVEDYDPDFDLPNTIKSLGMNETLTKLEIIEISNDTLDREVVEAFLMAIPSRHLVSLKKVHSLYIHDHKKMASSTGRFVKHMVGKNFDFTCIEHLFL